MTRGLRTPQPRYIGLLAFGASSCQRLGKYTAEPPSCAPAVLDFSADGTVSAMSVVCNRVFERLIAKKLDQLAGANQYRRAPLACANRSEGQDTAECVAE